jgi:hypothetical protein
VLADTNLGSLVTSLASCAPPADVGEHRNTIVGADFEDTAPVPVFPEVVRLDNGCTGTLITPSHVLTAAHCVDQSLVGSVEFVARAPDATENLTIPVVRCWMRNEYTRIRDRDPLSPPLRDGLTPELVGDRCNVFQPTGRTLGSGAIATEDFALLWLARPVPRPGTSIIAGAGAVQVTPGSLVTSFPTTSSVSVTLVGYGESTFMGGGAGIRRVILERTVAYRTTVLQGAGSTAPGDSGGPAFWDDGGGRAVLGVTSNTEFWGAVREEIVTWVTERTDVDDDGRIDIACRTEGHGTNPAATALDDPDGDGYVNDEDNAPLLYNPCQVTTDSDGDGLSDEVDACPGRSDLAAVHGALADRDEDGLPDECDCFPDVGNSSIDRDQDFVRDACDNCDGEPNPLQENCDDDREGDACDDEDADGVLDVCGALDNCPIPNANQSNCNADAEAVLGRAPMGDACDPTPCGDTRLEARTVRSGPFDYFQRSDVVRIDARASEPIEARTGLRFCPCTLIGGDSPSERLRCQGARFGCDIGVTTPYDADEADLPAWRHVTFDWSVTDGAPLETYAGDRPEVAALYDPPAGDFTTDLFSTWRLFEADVPRWDRVYGVDPGGAGEHPGVLWTHSPGARSGGLFTSEVRPVASHYWSGVVEPPRFLFRAPIPCAASIAPYLAPETCPLCAASFPEAYILVPGLPLGGRGLCLPSEWDPWLGLSAGLIPAGPRLPSEPPGPRPSSPWTFAAEPSELLASVALRHVVTDDAGGIAARMIVLGGALVVDGGCPPEQCPPGCPGPNCPLGLAARRTSAAPGSGPLAVLSALREELFWVGVPSAGRSVIRVLGVETGAARVLDPDVPLGRLLAATYLHGEDVLLILDEIEPERRGRTRQARLVRVDADTGSASVIATWPRRAPTSRFALAAGPDGSVYLAASGERGAHEVVRFALGGVFTSGAEPRVIGWAVGARPIVAGSAHASGVGVSLVTEGRDAEAVVRGYRAELLRRSHRGLDGCF